MVNRNLFILDEIPQFHPSSSKYIEFWREQKKLCIEGMWQSGYWMPGQLYFYVNFNTILLNKSINSKVKKPGRPFLRDLEWEFFYNWVEARGFSGFILDEETTCHRLAEPKAWKNITDFERASLKRHTPFMFKADGTLKKYEHARIYLKKRHPKSMGLPLYDNQSKDFMMLGCHSEGTKVRMFDGNLKKIEELEEGDLLLGPDSLSRKVKKLIRGFGNMYIVKQSKAEDYVVSEEHILVLKDRKGKVKERKVKDLLNLKLNKDGVIPSWKGFQSNVIEYNEKELPVDPYILGMWLGDGNTKSGIITNSDQEITDYVLEKYPESSIYSNNYSKNARRPNYKINAKLPLLNELRKLEVIGNKHIPDLYLYSSVKQRLELLAGLLDSDGSLDKKAYAFYQKDKALLEQVKLLCLSLGLSARVSYRRTRDSGKVHITGEITKVPSKLPRKVAEEDSKKYDSLVSLEPLGEDFFFGVELDGDSRYLLEDYTVTHNSRGFGKTYSVAGLVLHEWLFDGMTKYTPLGQLSNDDIPSINLTVGAGDSKYSDNLLGKVKYALGTLPGSQEVGGLVYPSPLSKQYTGSWNCGDAKGVRALYKKKIGGRWQDFGTQSSIKHRSFADNPFAANGLRCTMMIFEEIGMFSNLIASRNASVECCMDGANKFGTMMFLGTGGDMDKGTVDANIMFNDPDSFDLISFNDVWENNGKISYFVPAYMGLNQFKDDNGFTLKEPATDYLQRHRKKLRASKSGGSAIDEELQNRPLVPSEAFLTKKGNIFPIDELRQRLVKLRANDGFAYLEKCVELYFDSDVPSGVNYKLDMENELRPLNSFPLTEQQSKNREGCVVIYDFPITVEGSVPKDMYIIGHDPYATDDPDGDSLGAVYVLKSPKHPTYGGNEVVASFIGRPHQGRRIINEAIYKLSMFYGNAKIYFENVRGNVKEYFEKVKRLDLLAKQPTMVFNKKASYESTSKAIIYGYPMSGKAMKAEGIQYIRDWLLEERGELDGKIVRNLDMIPDKGLLQELIAFNYGGNFDRVMAFMGCIVGLEERFNRYMAPITDKKEKYTFLTKNANLFEERSNELESFTF